MKAVVWLSQAQEKLLPIEALSTSPRGPPMRRMLGEGILASMRGNPVYLRNSELDGKSTSNTSQRGRRRKD